MPKDKILSARGRLGLASSRHNAAAVAAARQELKTAILARDIDLALSEAPPITAAQRAELVSLLMSS